jgi:hypothetical protein
VKNWSVYEAALRRRGDIRIWIGGDVEAHWTVPGKRTPKGYPVYTDLAVETMLTLRLVFHQPLRQTKGLVGSIFDMMGLDLSVPDHLHGSVIVGITTGCPCARTACDYAVSPVLLVRLCSKIMFFPSRALHRSGPSLMIQPKDGSADNPDECSCRRIAHADGGYASPGRVAMQRHFRKQVVEPVVIAS